MSEHLCRQDEGHIASRRQADAAQEQVVTIPTVVVVTHEQHEQLLANRDTDQKIAEITGRVLDSLILSSDADQ